MLHRLSFLVLLCSCGLIAAQTTTEPNSKSPLAASNAGKEKFEGEFVPTGGKVFTIEVNTGNWRNIATIVKGFRFVGEDAKGKRFETVIGPVDGKYAKAIEVKPGVDVVGISGKHGLGIDSIRFHFSDGTTSPVFGGNGGSEEYRLMLAKKDGKYVGSVRGIFGRATEDTITGLGLLLRGRNGFPAKLDIPEELELIIRGDIDASFAPTVGRISTLFYECYPPLLKRFDNPNKMASRQITLHFKHDLKVPAYCMGSEISIHIEWLKQHPEDIALLTHELTHAIQLYPVSEPSWLVEGIADYARHVYGPKKQIGWNLPERLTPKQSYKDSYRTTGRFLLWLDEKHPGTVDKVHQRMQSREFALGDLKTMTGKTIDELWSQCVEELNKK
jgi:hypothetical protein